MIVICNKGTLKLKCNNNTISQLQKILGTNFISNAKFLKAKSGVKCVKLSHLHKTFLIFRGRSRMTRPPFAVGVQPPGVFVQDYIPPLGNFLSTWLCSTSLKHFFVRLPKNLSPTERLGSLLECMESLLQGPFKYETFQVMFYNPNPLLKLSLKLIPTPPQQPTIKKTINI